ncbi:MAG: hypothetical protein V3R64_03410 [Sphingomonadales bacterium]
MKLIVAFSVFVLLGTVFPTKGWAQADDPDPSSIKFIYYDDFRPINCKSTAGIELETVYEDIGSYFYNLPPGTVEEYSVQNPTTADGFSAIDPEEARDNIESIRITERLVKSIEQLYQIESQFNSEFIACNAFNNLLITYFQQREASLKHSMDLYKWQLFASNILLWLVVFIVLTSMVFTGYQLWLAGSYKTKLTNNEARISAKEIRITTSSVGIIVFTLSLIFLYMFIQDVYTIKKPITETAVQTEDDEEW